MFLDADLLGVPTSQKALNVDRLFESAAHFYRSGVIGVVLSGLGTDGTTGLLAIAGVDGVRVVQSPYEATFPSMPLSALIGDHVQYAVMRSDGTASGGAGREPEVLRGCGAGGSS